MRHEYVAEFRGGFRARLVIATDRADCEWTPHPPDFRGQRRRKFLATYRMWRNEAIADFAKKTGLRIAVADL